MAEEAGLGPDVAAFVADAAAAVDQRYTVTYELRSGERVIVSQDPPRRRIDFISVQEIRRLLILDDGSYSCVKSAAWSCQKASGNVIGAGAFAQSDVDETVAALTAAKEQYTFRVESRRIAGAGARCLVTEPRPAYADGSASTTTGAPPPAGTHCISDVGVPLLIDGPEQHLEAIRYERDADSAGFDLPAPVR